MGKALGFAESQIRLPQLLHRRPSPPLSGAGYLHQVKEKGQGDWVLHAQESPRQGLAPNAYSPVSIGGQNMALPARGGGSHHRRFPGLTHPQTGALHGSKSPSPQPKSHCRIAARP